MAKDLEDNGWPRERSPDLLVSHPLGSVVLLKSSRVDPEREKKKSLPSGTSNAYGESGNPLSTTSSQLLRPERHETLWF